MRALRSGLSLLIVAGALPGEAATIVRGPYLQRTSTAAVVLRWRTDVATDTWAGWGEVAGAYDQTTSAREFVTEHIVQVSGLAAKTLYYYAVGTTQSVLAGGDSAHRLRTACVAGDSDAQHLWVTGDCGATSLPLCGGPATLNAALVRDGYFTWADNATPDLWLLLGDNAYCSGTDADDRETQDRQRRQGGRRRGCGGLQDSDLGFAIPLVFRGVRVEVVGRSVLFEPGEQLARIRFARAFDQDVHRPGEDVEPGAEAADAEEILDALPLGEVGDPGLVENRMRHRQEARIAGLERRHQIAIRRIPRLRRQHRDQRHVATLATGESFPVFRPALWAEHRAPSLG